ncbi:MAG: hypothetical protein J7L51_03985 [Desulfurococcales archaeon]|nr:hypothetical protein [Desulfurococcales archaeon]
MSDDKYRKLIEAQAIELYLGGYAPYPPKTYQDCVEILFRDISARIFTFVKTNPDADSPIVLQAMQYAIRLLFYGTHAKNLDPKTVWQTYQRYWKWYQQLLQPEGDTPCPETTKRS